MEEEKQKKLKIGDLLVQEGYISKAQLEEALNAQKKTKEYAPIGELCVKLKFISREDFKKFLRKNQNRIYFGELLVNMGLITADKMQEALEIQKVEKKKIGLVLVEKGFITEAHLVNTLSIQLGIPKIIPDINLLDKKLFKGLNAAFLLKNEAIPAFQDGDAITVIMADPLDAHTIHALANFFRRKIEPAVATSTDIKNAVTLYYRKLEFGPESPSGSVEAADDIKALIIGDAHSAASGDNIYRGAQFYHLPRHNGGRQRCAY